MEQARFWMWAKTKPEMLNPHILSPAVGDSWEEQAFAEDAAGTLVGGCVWPPRSYSCSFCRREFRSAQALGGHMNVHRRDRARLKQSPIPPTDEASIAPQIHDLNTCTSFHPKTPSYPCTIMYNNPNPDQLPDPLVRSPLIRVSSSLHETNKEEKKTSTLSFFSSRHQDDKNSCTISLSIPPSWSGSVSGKRDRIGHIMDSKKNEGKGGTNVVVEAEKEDCVRDQDRLSVNLNSDVCGTLRNEEEVLSCKRRRIEAKSFSLFPKLSSSDHRCVPQVDMLKLRSGSGEELDLELRLGDGPKVK